MVLEDKSAIVYGAARSMGGAVARAFSAAGVRVFLVGRTIETLTLGNVPASVALPVLAAWEVAIGLGLIIGRWMRAVLLLLIAQMLGTITPLVLFPAETFVRIPYAPTLEGQYIIKNIVLVTAAIVLGATVRGGELTNEPVVVTRQSGGSA